MRHTPPPSDDDLAELLADKLVELALSKPGLFRLAALQMAGLLPERDLDDVTIATHLGCTSRTVHNIRRAGLEKLACRPDVLALAQSITAR